MDHINAFFSIEDVLKAVLALASGIILGYERESKDKSAGLKTITLISVGSCLFTILSANFSGEGDNFAIAAGIISGIGFLGAGVIYKQGFSIYGLTTASIIWVSAAIGMAIGFGEFYIALSFLITTLVVIYGLSFLGKALVPNNNTRFLIFEIRKKFAGKRTEILDDLEKFSKFQSVNKTEKKENGNVVLSVDISLKQRQTEELENFLLDHPAIESFQL